MRATREGLTQSKVSAPVLDGGEEIVRFADPEHVPRLVFGQFLVHPPSDGAEVLLLERTADPVAVEATACFAGDRLEIVGGLAS